MRQKSGVFKKLSVLLILSDMAPWVPWALSPGTVVRSDSRLCISSAGLDGLKEWTAKLVTLPLPSLFLRGISIGFRSQNYPVR